MGGGGWVEGGGSGLGVIHVEIVYMCNIQMD